LKAFKKLAVFAILMFLSMAEAYSSEEDKKINERLGKLVGCYTTISKDGKEITSSKKGWSEISFQKPSMVLKNVDDST